jgi:FkbM family methyltransferase
MNAYWIIILIIITVLIVYFYYEYNNGPMIRIKNPIDGQSIIWEKSSYIDNNYPNLNYSPEEKRQIFNIACGNKYGMGVIDVGAHIGDLAIPLAQALTRVGRGDVIVYAIDPSPDKCEFMEKISRLNGIENIRIINYGLLDREGPLSPNRIMGKNTGGTRWDSLVDGEENSMFTTADNLLAGKVLGPIGLYHIDVEGGEDKVILGSIELIEQFNPVMIIESWKDSNNKWKIEEDSPIKGLMQVLNPPYYPLELLANGDIVYTHSCAKITAIIPNFARPHNLDILIPKLKAIPEIDQIIISHGNPKTYKEFTGVTNIQNFDINDQYGAAQRFFSIDHAKNDMILSLDDDHVPSRSLIRNLLIEAEKDPINIYGPYKRLCTDKGYSAKYPEYNIIITGLAIVHKSIIQSFIENFNDYSSFLKFSKGNGEDILLNHNFRMVYGKAPVHVSGKFSTLDEDTGSYRGMSTHNDIRNGLCKQIAMEI